jgi:glycine/sarcosine N-methyltransferase
MASAKKLRKKSLPKKSGPKKPLRKKIVSQNVPQIESLLSEIEYGEALALYFDTIYSEQVLTKVQKPFYQMLLRKYGIQSACDLSCRTGQTLKLLSRLGIKKLAGVDVSPAMIARCKKKLPKSVALFTEELYLAPNVVPEGQFDLVLCTKDSLPSVLDDEALLNFFTQARKLLTDKGVFIVELWNYERIWRNKERFMPVMDRVRTLFFFENDFHEELLVRNMVRLEKSRSEWFLRSLSIPVRPITRNEIDFFVKEAQFSQYGYLGSYAGAPYHPSETMYTILIAKK